MWSQAASRPSPTPSLLISSPPPGSRRSSPPGHPSSPPAGGPSRACTLTSVCTRTNKVNFLYVLHLHSCGSSLPGFTSTQFIPFLSFSLTQGPHYDTPQPSPNPLTPTHSSEWTLLIYLSPPPPAPQLVGGETVFHLSGKRGGEVVVAPKSGMALLHRHGSGRECLIHEGRKVEKGSKWVLRSDVMFG